MPTLSARPKQGIETPFRSTCDSYFSERALALAPMRNVTQEFDTRAMICMSTSAMLDIPALTCPDGASSNSDEEDETIPTFSLLRRKRQRDEKDTVATSITMASRRSFKKLQEDCSFSLHMLSPIDKTVFKSE
ncbi:unnamed protein product [Cylindrotheca closterium]|uniref:Uncharacterized protein n=1 Tax=Cylindrotheca closterium TaxID=2856 RepID=A0AAD2CM35_9STRA|nr:unnamed protein product [Cylindrotheca closterium]